jgi:hypothetical protein
VPTTVACDAPGESGTELLVRPDWAALGGELPGRVAAVRFGGPHTDYQLVTPAGEILVREPGSPRYAAGTPVTWTLRRAWPVSSGSGTAHPVKADVDGTSAGGVH